MISERSHNHNSKNGTSNELTKILTDQERDEVDDIGHPFIPTRRGRIRWYNKMACGLLLVN